MQDISVDKQSHHKSPDFALLEVDKAEDKILLSEHRLLLPSPDASPDASEYQQRIDSQGIVNWIFLASYSTFVRKRKAKQPFVIADIQWLKSSGVG